MKRSSERLIDVVVLGMLLAFGYAMREIQPALAGVITAAAVQFWLAKNASEPKASVEETKALATAVAAEAAALAAAEVLKVARIAVADGEHSSQPPPH